MIAKLRWLPTGSHYRCLLYIGPSRDHLTLAGELTFTPEEAAAYRDLLFTGDAEGTMLEVTEQGWREPVAA